MSGSSYLSRGYTATIWRTLRNAPQPRGQQEQLEHKEQYEQRAHAGTRSTSDARSTWSTRSTIKNQGLSEIGKVTKVPLPRTTPTSYISISTREYLRGRNVALSLTLYCSVFVNQVHFKQQFCLGVKSFLSYERRKPWPKLDTAETRPGHGRDRARPRCRGLGVIAFQVSSEHQETATFDMLYPSPIHEQLV